MNKIVHLSLTNKSVPARFDVVQYATNPAITFVLDDYMPSGTANLYIQKPDGTEIYNACTISGNNVTYQPTTQSFAAVGINKGQLQIVEPNGTAVSFVMFIDVSENIIDSAAIESQDEFTALEEALQTVSAYDGRITGIETRLSTATFYFQDSTTFQRLGLDPTTATTADIFNAMAVDSVFLYHFANTDAVCQEIGITGATVLLFKDYNSRIMGFANEYGGEPLAVCYRVPPAATLTVRWDKIGSTALTAKTATDNIQVILRGANTGETGSVTVPNNTPTAVGKIILPPGDYYIESVVAFVENPNGYRLQALSTTEGVISGMGWQNIDTRVASGGIYVVTRIGTIVSPRTETTYFVNVVQNSGGNLNCNPRAAVFRFK